MTLLTSASRLFASALLLCAAAAAPAADEPADKTTLDQIKQILDELKKQKDSQSSQTVNAQALAVESWLLTSTAIDSTAQRIHDVVADRVPSGERKLLVVGGAEPLDFNLSDMLALEISSLSRRLKQASDIQCQTVRGQMIESFPAVIAAAGAFADLLKTETELAAMDQDVDAKLLAAAVAGKFGNAVLPSAAVAASPDAKLLQQFDRLVSSAEAAQSIRDRLAAKKDPSGCETNKKDVLTAVLTDFDKFYPRVTTANKDGVVPLILAARLDQILDRDPVVLRVTKEKAGGTLLKRKNLLTAFGAETAFISGGLVTSYQLTRPRTGELLRSGVVTCRTTLSSLKRVQEGSWSSPVRSDPNNPRSQPMAVCSP